MCFLLKFSENYPRKIKCIIHVVDVIVVFNLISINLYVSLIQNSSKREMYKSNHLGLLPVSISLGINRKRLFYDPNTPPPVRGQRHNLLSRYVI